MQGPASMANHSIVPAITLTAEGQDIYIHDIMPGSAAHASGKLLVNDRIIAIRDSLGKMEPVSGKSMLEVSFTEWKKRQ